MSAQQTVNNDQSKHRRRDRDTFKNCAIQCIVVVSIVSIVGNNCATKKNIRNQPTTKPNTLIITQLVDQQKTKRRRNSTSQTPHTHTHPVTFTKMTYAHY